MWPRPLPRWEGCSVQVDLRSGTVVAHRPREGPSEGLGSSCEDGAPMAPSWSKCSCSDFRTMSSSSATGSVSAHQ